MSKFPAWVLVSSALVGCGVAPGTPAATGKPVAAVAMRAMAAARDATAAIPYRSSRYPFHSDKFDLERGAFQPLDDGMGPGGDLHFFYDGSRFFVLPNLDGGAQRAIAPAPSDGDTTALVFHTGPVAIVAGDRLIVRNADGIHSLVITGLDVGDMRLAPQGGTGSGSVTFRYGA